MSDHAVRHARLYLMALVEPPAPALSAFVATHGPVDAATHIRQASVPPAVLAEIAQPAPDLTPSLDALDSGSARLIIPEDQDWPDALRETSLGTPLALWAKGSASLTQLTTRAVTVTGARAATGYGHQVATDFGYDLARHDVTVVSTTAYGVDSSVLSAAVAAHGRAVAVCSGGLDRPYPAGSTSLLTDIVDCGGLLVSQYPPGTLPSRTRFVASRRLTAALSHATVIVEAGKRSGAHATAAAAQSLGRSVYAVPGSITSALSWGANDLIRQGIAIAITAADQVVL